MVVDSTGRDTLSWLLRAPAHRTYTQTLCFMTTLTYMVTNANKKGTRMPTSKPAKTSKLAK